MGDWTDKGYIYLYGMGTERNAEEALQCFRKGADAGDMLACWAIYEDMYGSGVSLVSDDEAMEMCRRAAALGHEKAAMILKTMGGGSAEYSRLLHKAESLAHEQSVALLETMAIVGYECDYKI